MKLNYLSPPILSPYNICIFVGFLSSSVSISPNWTAHKKRYKQKRKPIKRSWKREEEKEFRYKPAVCAVRLLETLS